MVTEFIAVEVALQPSVAELELAIAQTLQQHGEPLRWAITSVDGDRQIAHIEAVITIGQVETR